MNSRPVRRSIPLKAWIRGNPGLGRSIGAALMTLATAASIRLLWLLWTPRCEEACTLQTLLGMCGALLASMLLTAVLAVLLLVGRFMLRRGTALYAVGWAVLVSASALLKL